MKPQDISESFIEIIARSAQIPIRLFKIPASEYFELRSKDYEQFLINVIWKREYKHMWE